MNKRQRKKFRKTMQAAFKGVTIACSEFVAFYKTDKQIAEWARACRQARLERGEKGETNDSNS